MGRAGCLVLVLLAVVVGVISYNQWQIERKVTAIAERLQAPATTSGRRSAGGDLVTPLARAQKHTLKARQLLREHKYSEAQRELDQAIASLKSVEGVSRDLVGQASEFLGKAGEAARKQFTRTLDEILKEAQAEHSSKPSDPTDK